MGSRTLTLLLIRLTIFPQSFSSVGWGRCMRCVLDMSSVLCHKNIYIQARKEQDSVSIIVVASISLICAMYDL